MDKEVQHGIRNYSIWGFYGDLQGYIGVSPTQNPSDGKLPFYSIFGQQRDNGKEHGNYYSI